ncbi:hypothetical protein Q8A73_012054 [Channa argus]|nr:hypothetical protein Q8A73_012054 [Channa argus]
MKTIHGAIGAMARKLSQTLSSHAAFYHCGLFVGSSQGLGGLGDQRGTKWGLCLNDLDSGRQKCRDTKFLLLWLLCLSSEIPVQAVWTKNLLCVPWLIRHSCEISSTVITRYPSSTRAFCCKVIEHGTHLQPCPALSGDVCLCQEPQLVGRVPNH